MTATTATSRRSRAILDDVVAVRIRAVVCQDRLWSGGETTYERPAHLEREMVEVGWKGLVIGGLPTCGFQKSMGLGWTMRHSRFCVAG